MQAVTRVTRNTNCIVSACVSLYVATQAAMMQNTDQFRCSTHFNRYARQRNMRCRCKENSYSIAVSKTNALEILFRVAACLNCSGIAVELADLVPT